MYATDLYIYFLGGEVKVFCMYGVYIYIYSFAIGFIVLRSESLEAFPLTPAFFPKKKNFTHVLNPHHFSFPLSFPLYFSFKTVY